MREHPRVRRTLLSVLIVAMGMPPLAGAEQLALVQYPAGGAVRQPAPNVILTLDDSGSMGYYTNGGTKQDETKDTSRMYVLKTALRSLFDAGAQNIPDGSIRLAWNTMNNCRAIPSNSGGCGNLNRMRVLDATHRAAFLNWVGTPGVKSSSKLTASGSTPTHHAYIAAGDYLMNGSITDGESPWADVPGTEQVGDMKACRRSYNVLMTDGGWNFSLSTHGTDVARPIKGFTNPNADGGQTFQLPDKEWYDITKDYTRIYRDSWGRTISGYPVSTLADLAFFYWATDLSNLPNKLVPLKEREGAEPIGGYQMPEYWNPRNNPATWQHMTTYTIGFGDAAEWRTALTYAAYPAWDLAKNDTFGGSLPDMIAGTGLRTTWPNPFKGPNGSVSTLSLEESNNLNLDAASTNEDARKAELWHMALNSRGKFIASTSKESLVAAFREIFSKIIADSSTPVSSFASASSSISRSATTQYTSGYQADGWRGYVLADALSQDPKTGVVSVKPSEGWGTQNTTPANVTTATKLDATTFNVPNRLVLTWSESGARGTSFQWTQDPAPATALSALSADQKSLLRAEPAGSASELVGEQRLKFVRGDLSQDGKTYEGTPFRKRLSRQGDIVNSALWYVADPVSGYAVDNYQKFAETYAKRLPMVYVGGNDGMLHGFSGIDGSEKIAYVPKGVIANLPEFTRPSYTHRYYVDGSPFTGDVSVGSPKVWRTMLVGSLGAGGKGYFVLDVTNPGGSVSGSTLPNEFVKAKAETLVVMDKTSVAGSSAEDADIGHIFATPVVEDANALKSTQITRMNNGRWAVVMGNGYNSTNERPVLLIQYLDGSKELLKIVASTATGAGNGLSAPRLVDLDGNGTVDLVYAGDLRGNLWKFDLTQSTQEQWGVGFAGQPLYTAKYVDARNVSHVQPITAPPLVRANERGVAGLMVAFGTGRNLTEADRTDTAVQSIYSVLDGTRYKIESNKLVVDTSCKDCAAAPVTDVRSLVPQTIETQISGQGTSTSRTFWTISQNAVGYTGTDKKMGWYLNLPAGERVLAQMGFYDSSNIIELISEVPASGGSTTAGESCEPSSKEVQKYRTLLNIMDGLRPSVQVMDTNGDGLYTAADGYTSRMTAGRAENKVTTGSKEIRVGNDKTDQLARLPEIPLRPNWRQLQ